MFLDAAVLVAKPDGGMIAFLTPPSFLAGQYFRNLRRLLREQAPPVCLDLVESRADMFDDVLQKVALSAWRNAPAGAACRYPCAAFRAADRADRGAHPADRPAEHR